MDAALLQGYGSPSDNADIERSEAARAEHLYHGPWKAHVGSFRMGTSIGTQFSPIANGHNTTSDERPAYAILPGDNKSHIHGFNPGLVLPPRPPPPPPPPPPPRDWIPPTPPPPQDWQSPYVPHSNLVSNRLEYDDTKPLYSRTRRAVSYTPQILKDPDHQLNKIGHRQCLSQGANPPESVCADNIFACHYAGCDQLFVRWTDFKEHCDHAHKRHSREFWCPKVGCERSQDSTTGKPFERRRQLKDHLRTHIGPQESKDSVQLLVNEWLMSIGPTKPAQHASFAQSANDTGQTKPGEDLAEDVSTPEDLSLTSLDIHSPSPKERHIAPSENISEPHLSKSTVMNQTDAGSPESSDPLLLPQGSTISPFDPEAIPSMGDADMSVDADTTTEHHTEESSGDEFYYRMADIDAQKLLAITRILHQAHDMFARTTCSSRGNNVTGQSGQHQSQQSSGSSGQPSSSGSHATGKREREVDENSGDSGSRDGKQRKVQQKLDGQNSRKKLACPFFKRDAIQHNSPPCSGPGWTDVSRIKEHLYRKHQVPIHCERCRSTFTTKELLTEHTRSPEPCHLSVVTLLPGMTEAQMLALKSKKAMFGQNKNEEAKWRIVYTILFPDTHLGKIPSPYYDSAEIFECSTTEYQAHLQQNLPRQICDFYSTGFGDFNRDMVETALADSIRLVTREFITARQVGSTLYGQAGPSSSSLSARTNAGEGQISTPVEQDGQSSIDSHRYTPQSDSCTGSMEQAMSFAHDLDPPDFSFFSEALEHTLDLCIGADDWFDAHAISLPTIPDNGIRDLITSKPSDEVCAGTSFDMSSMGAEKQLEDQRESCHDDYKGKGKAKA